MRSERFDPKEVLLSLTAMCNLHCAHCDIEQKPGLLDKKSAIKFLAACSRYGIKRLGFTGGEPFLALGLMCAISKKAAAHGIFFSRIMTNGVWFRNDKELVSALGRLFKSGYDGELCMSVDAFHCQDIKKCASFIKSAVTVWRRNDIVSIAAVKGAKERQTREMLVKLASVLRGRLIISGDKPIAIKAKDVFVKIYYIDLSPVGKASGIRNAWDGKWFKDDMCKGPGNVLFVLPDGTVKPCCGYASDSDILTIGSIKRDSPRQLIKNARSNRFVSSVLSSGLHPIRRRLEGSGIKFPGKTTNHCFFCRYITETIPRSIISYS